MLKISLYNTIIRLGFRSGVFHVEARVWGSNPRYQLTKHKKSLDLCPSLVHALKDATVFLIETNVRPHGYVDRCASHFANGVDLLALQNLIALRDEPRVKALVTAISLSSLCRGLCSLKEQAGRRFVRRSVESSISKEFHIDVPCSTICDEFWKGWFDPGSTVGYCTVAFRVHGIFTKGSQESAVSNLPGQGGISCSIDKL